MFVHAMVMACVTTFATKSNMCLRFVEKFAAKRTQFSNRTVCYTLVYGWAHNGMDDLFIFRLELNYVYMSITDVYLLFTVGDKFGLKLPAGNTPERGHSSQASGPRPIPGRHTR